MITKRSLKKENDNLKEQLQDLNNYISNGSWFAANEQIKAQSEKAKLTWANIDSELNDVDKEILNYTGDTVPQKYFIYWQYCIYFTNIFKYETNSAYMNSQIKKMLSIGFFNGKAGLYYNDITKRWQAVAVNRVHTTPYGTIRGYDISLTYNFNITDGDDVKRTQDEYMRYVPARKLVYYQMKQHGFSCWVWLRELVNIQERMLKQITVCNLIDNKIIGVSVENKTDLIGMLKNYLNPYKWFIKYRDSNSLTKDIKFLNKDNANVDISLKYLEIYRQTMGVYKDMYGIRNNLDFKKERNLTGEINATQQWFDIVEGELTEQFALFVERLSENPLYTGEIIYDTSKFTDNRRI